MKRAFTILIALSLAFGIISLPHNDVHAYSEGQRYKKCPQCGSKNFYIEDMMQDATCTSSGLAWCHCSNCDYGGEITLAALGHNYKSTVIKAATCTAAGTKKLTCKRCSNSYTENIPALGHNYKDEVQKEATCEEDGLLAHICSRCHDTKTEIIEKLGHDFGEFIVKKSPTCEDDGYEESECSRCHETVINKIEKLGHDYPSEWKVEKQAGILTTGLQSKTCSRCDNRIEEVIPAKVKASTAAVLATPVIIGSGYALLRFLKKKKTVKSPKKTFSPSIESKTIVICTEDNELISNLKSQPYLKIVPCEYDKLQEAIEENEPHLVICDTLSKDRLNEVLDIEDVKFGIITSKFLYKKNRDRLKQLKKEGKVVSCILSEEREQAAMLKLILPILKPELKSCETLENIGSLCDYMGIPGVSTVIGLYSSGRDIKETLSEEELGVSGIASVIGSVASILGLERVESIAGLVDNIDSIKESLDSKKGNYEKREGVEALSDVADVFSDFFGS